MQIPREVFANIMELAMGTLDADDVVHNALTDLQRDATRVAFGGYRVDGIGCPLTQVGVFDGNFNTMEASVPAGPLHPHFRSGFMHAFDQAALAYVRSVDGTTVSQGTLTVVA